MEDIIDSSPPSSQRKRKNFGKCHTSQKTIKRDPCNVEDRIESKSKDVKFNEESSVGQMNDSMTRSDMLRRVHILEQANKASSQKYHTVKRYNNNRLESRLSTRAGFLSATEICASQSSSTHHLGENHDRNSEIVTNSKCDTFFETQDFTESQIQTIENDTKLIAIANNDQKSNCFEPTNIGEEDNAVSNDCDKLTVAVADVNNRVVENTSEDTVNTCQNSLKRQRSTVESILNEWPTSPVKKKKTSSEQMQFSPKFKFNKKRIIRTYHAKRRSNVTKKLIPESKMQSPATASSCSAIGIHSDDDDENMRRDICQEEIVPANANEEEVDLNKSIKIIDNIHNLSEYYSQSVSGTIVNDINETFKVVMDLKLRMAKSSRSLEDEEDFLGFDKKFTTLSEKFYDFVSEDETSTNSIIDQHHDVIAKDQQYDMKAKYQYHDMLTEDDDDIFVNFKTQYNLPVASTSTAKVSDDLFRENVSRDFRNSENISCSVALGETYHLFEDIKNESDFARPNNYFQSPFSLDLMEKIPNNRTNSTYPNFATFERNRRPVSLSPKKTKIFENVEVTGNCVNNMYNWIGDIDGPSESSATALKESSSNVRPTPTYAGFSTARGRLIPVSSAQISKKTNIFRNVELTGNDITNMNMNNWISDNDIKIDRLNESPVVPVSIEGVTNVRSNPTFTGFSTARGKQIPVSSTLISKKTNIFQNVEVSDVDVRNMDDWFDDKERDSDIKIDGLSESPATVSKESTSNVKPTPTYPGFSTPTGKQIPVSSALISKKTNIFQNVEVSDVDVRNMDDWFDDKERDSDIKIDGLSESPATVSKESISNVKPTPTYPGFLTPTGKQIPVSSALITKKTNIFQNVEVSDVDVRNMDDWFDDKERDCDIKIDNCNENPATISKKSILNVKPTPAFPGFSTARGKQIPVSSTLLSTKTNIFQNVEVTHDDVRAMNNWFGESERDDNINVDRLSEIPVSELKERIESLNATSSGFSTARGRQLPIVKRATNIKDINKDYVRKTDQHQNSLHNALSSNYHCDEKTNQSSSAGCFREVTNSLHSPQKETNMVSQRNMLIGKGDTSPVTASIKPSPLRRMSMVNSLRKLEMESLKENIESNSLFEINDNTYPTSSIHTPASSNAYNIVTPKTLTQDCREVVEIFLQDLELSSIEQDSWSMGQTPGFMEGIKVDLVASSTPIRKIDGSLNRPKQTRLIERFDDLAGDDYFRSSVQMEPKIQVPLDIISLRRKAFEVQRQSINGKTNTKAVPGTLYVTKLTAQKLKWREFVDNSHPTTITLGLGNNALKLADNVLHVTSENATKFKFNAWDHYPYEFCQENVNGIHLKDDMVVMMDENCQIGLKEISNAFLSCPSVDPKLIHDKWMENSMKWIVVKLAGMERSFPHRFAGNVLTIENVMLQMKYRYDREVDHVERSAIRKICEMDDIPAKRMILFVARITTNGYQCEVELSDGWYSLSSTLDNEMRKLVIKGKIKVGTKLLVQGAELEHLDSGCYPLDVPSNARLRIHYNSTRRAKWDSRLGYCKNPEPFKISLRSVLAFGGRITKLNICVLRVYPIVYYDTKSTSAYKVHSEKAEIRRSIKDERDRSIIVDKIYSQVSKELEDEEKAARYENRPRKIPKLSDISTITDPAVLFNLLEEDNDPDRIANEMTHSQKAMLLNYKEKLNCTRMEEINHRVKEKLAFILKNQGKFIPLLKFKIADEMSFDHAAIVTIWKPTDDMFSLIQEGAVYEMTSAKARGFEANEMQIYAGKDTIFKKLYSDRVPSIYCRRHISISEIVSIDAPVLNELDTTGIVVHVGDATNIFQAVYIADADCNIVRINFWMGLTKYAYDDVVKPKRFLAIKNLQWRSTSNSKPIPCTYASDFSTFTENPTSPELLSAISSLKLKFESVNMEEFFDVINLNLNKIS